MRICLAVTAAAFLLAGQAIAGDAPLFAPAPVWVKPVPTPAPPPASDEPVRHILFEQQILLEPQGQTIYTSTATEIQTPDGLNAGNISLEWRPDSGDLTIHKLLIRRGDEVIDVLESGQTFTVVRRENNLESATLDGVLTANIQPEGLQVGDVLELATTITSNDPTMRGHAEVAVTALNAAPMARAHMVFRWPSDLPVRIRQVGDLPKLRPVTRDGVSSTELRIDNLEPMRPPGDAPMRYALQRLIELTSFESWAEVSRKMAPLYDKASVLPTDGALRNEVNKIRDLPGDSKLKTEAALALVQDRVRYVALSMGSGNLTPANAATTWGRRYGDCKGKTALLLAILRELGVDAEPVLVHTALGDGLDQRLPMVTWFNHVLVRARIDGKTYWLDGTRTGDTSLDRLRTPAAFWGLPITTAGEAELVRMMPEPLTEPEVVTTIHMDATKGLGIAAPTRIETVFRGDEAVRWRALIASVAGDARDKALKAYWREEYDFIEAEKTGSGFDVQTGEMRIWMEGLADMDWAGGRYETDDSSVGYRADFSRPPGADRDAPFVVPYPIFTRTIQTILTPPGAFTVSPGSDVDQTAGGIHYRRQARVDGNVYVIQTDTRTIAHEIPFDEAARAQAQLRTLAEKVAYLEAPRNYRVTSDELDALSKRQVRSLSEHLNRGNTLLDAGRYDEALLDFDAAVALDPANALALAHRGLAKAWKEDFEPAAADLDSALAIDPKNAVAYRARGVMAEARREWRKAADAYTASLDADPNNSFALSRRAVANRALGNREAAIADAGAALRLNPHWVDGYLLRANLLYASGRSDEALKLAEAAGAENPESQYAHVVAGRLFGFLGKPELAIAAFDKALAIEDSAFVYLNRAEVRAKSDLTGRRADIEAALSREPDIEDGLSAKARVQGDAGDLAGAAETYSAIIAKDAKDLNAFNGRGIIYARMGRRGPAEKDFARARDLAERPADLNNLCWDKALAGTALEAALRDCNLALAQAPDAPNFLDSKGLVLLRIGRLDEALETYDRVLKDQPEKAHSLYGRAVAWARKGDKERSDADAAAAIALDPGIAEEFKDFGVER